MKTKEIRVLNTSDSLNSLAGRLKESDRVFFSRYGDNDVMMMTGQRLNGQPLDDRPCGGNGTVYSPELQKELAEGFLIKDPNFLKGLCLSYELEPGMKDGVFAPFRYNDRLQMMVESLTDEKLFLSNVLFLYLIMFKREVFEDFLDTYIRPYPKLYIGGVDKRHVQKVIGPCEYVQTPMKNAYSAIDQWFPQVEEKVQGVKVVIPSCGQSSRVVNKRLYEMGLNIWSIDFGSLFDAVAGLGTRTWIREEGHILNQIYN